MLIFSVRTVVLAAAVSASSLAGAATLSEQSELLCSPEGLMRLIPQFNVNGKFAIPDPNTDLQTFLSAQQGYATTHSWFQVEKLDARSHFPTLEVPGAVSTAIARFVEIT